MKIPKLLNIWFVWIYLDLRKIFQRSLSIWWLTHELRNNELRKHEPESSVRKAPSRDRTGRKEAFSRYCA